MRVGSRRRPGRWPSIGNRSESAHGSCRRIQIAPLNSTVRTVRSFFLPRRLWLSSIPQHRRCLKARSGKTQGTRHIHVALQHDAAVNRFGAPRATAAASGSAARAEEQANTPADMRSDGAMTAAFEHPRKSDLAPGLVSKVR